MSIKVHEILGLKNFNTFRLIAGANGLNREVVRSGFIDHESAETLRSIAFNNEIIFSNMMIIKGQPDKITDFVKAAIDSGCSGFAIKTTFFDAYPDEAIDLANQCNFPLFLFDETYIDDLIIDIDEAVNINKKIIRKKALFQSIEEDDLNQFKIKSKAIELNKHFHNNYMIYAVTSLEHDIDRFDYKSAQKIMGKSSLVLPFDNFVIFTHSYLEKDMVSYENLFNSLGITKNYTIGISEAYDSLGLFDQAIHQAKNAMKFAAFKDKQLVEYKTLGLYKMLIPLLDNKHVVSFYETYIDILSQYDIKHQSDLVETARAYIACDGDIKATAKKLYQHDNTIRYRVKKISQLLELDLSLGCKYETLATSIHLYELNKKQNILNLL